MGTAGYTAKVKISVDDVTYTDLPITSPSLSHGADILDDTELATNAGYRSKIYGLLDWSVSGECQWVASQTALDAVRNAMINRSTLYVQYLPDGTLGNGFEGQVRVESFDFSSPVDGAVTVSTTLQGTGALTQAN